MCTEKRGQILTTYCLLRSRYINMRGIWSNSSLSVPSEYGATLGDDFKGDRIALTVDGRNFKLYKGIELVSSGTIPDELSITGASSFFGWKGLKQVMA